jgi:hypothetical protein
LLHTHVTNFPHFIKRVVPTLYKQAKVFNELANVPGVVLGDILSHDPGVGDVPMLQTRPVYQSAGGSVVVRLEPTGKLAHTTGLHLLQRPSNW